jgi:hypothetical protein
MIVDCSSKLIISESTSLDYKQTRRVSQTIVFHYREIGITLCTKHRKK